MKRLYCYTLLLIIVTHSSFAQNKQQLPALLQKLSGEKNDSVKEVILTEIANIYFSNNENTETIPYALEALRLRERFGNKKKVVGALDFIGQAYLNTKDYEHARKYWLRTLTIKDELHDTVSYISILHNIGVMYSNESNLLKAKEFYTKALQKSREIKHKYHTAGSLLRLGLVNNRLALYPVAEENLQESLILYEELGDIYNVAGMLNNLSNLYNNQANFPKALEYGFKSLKLSEQYNFTWLVATNLNDLTITFSANRQYDTAISYLFRAKDFFKTNDTLLAYILSNIGTVYALKGNNEQALPYLNQALKLAENLNLHDVRALALLNRSLVFETKGNYTTALGSINQSLALSRMLGNQELIAKNLTRLGQNFLRLSKDSLRNNWPDSMAALSGPVLLRQAIFFLDSSVNISKRISKLDLLQENYRLLSQAQEAIHDNAAALKSTRLYILYRDSVFNLDKVRDMNRIELQYQYDKQSAEKDKELALSKAAARFRLRLAIIIGSAIILVSVLFFYFRRRIERNKYKLEITGLKQQALNAQMSDHFISNTIDSINQFIKKNDKEKASEYLLRFHRLVRKVLENAPEKMIPVRDDLEVLNNYIELEKLRFTQGSLEYKIIVDEQIDQDITLIPPMIFQILVENAIKHGFKKKEGGLLLVSLEKKEDYIECRVEDNGSGRNISSIVQDNAQPERRSIGGSLAEKLIKAAGKYKDKTYFKITDLLTPVNTPAGTAVQFSLPYTLAD